jgi:hypothetical protein
MSSAREIAVGWRRQSLGGTKNLKTENDKIEFLDAV